MQLTADFNMIYVTNLICFFYSICISLRSQRSRRLAVFLLVCFAPKHECKACRDHASKNAHPHRDMYSVNNNFPPLQESQKMQKRDYNKKDRGNGCERFHG